MLFGLCLILLFSITANAPHYNIDPLIASFIGIGNVVCIRSVVRSSQRDLQMPMLPGDCKCDPMSLEVREKARSLAVDGTTLPYSHQ